MKQPLFNLQYEHDQEIIPSDYIEKGAESCARLTPDQITDPDMRRIFEVAQEGTLKDTLKWLSMHRDEMAPSTYIIDISANGNRRIPRRSNGEKYDAIVVQRPLHTIYEVDRFLADANQRLTQNGYLYCNSRTSAIKREIIKKQFPKAVAAVVYFFHYLWHCVCPKLRLTKKLYFLLSGGKNRTFHRVEILGRLYRAGFEVLNENTQHGEFRVLCRRAKDPITDDVPTGAPLIKLNRVGKDGKMIGVYKFRTMYAYSEYIQPYVYAYHNLDNSGKFANDFRVNFWGKVLRATWLDELPMMFNVLKGQMKLVGVRPLSRHYFSLYTPEMQQLRVKVKPGMLPPFYYEEKTPETLEEIQESERRYTEAYLQHPFLTDWRYFWGILAKIVLKRRKSH